jgi:hypothetical protein
VTDTSTETVDEPTAAPEGETKTKRSYADLPEGVTTLAKFANVLKEQRGVEVRPQVIFGYSRQMKEFPSYQHSDQRWVINIADGLAWWDAKEQRKSEREAKKAAAASETASE